MVVVSGPVLEEISLIPCQKQSTFTAIPTIDLSHPDSKSHLIHACEEYGFFKVINHGIPLQLMSDLENEALRFFSQSQSEKEKAGQANPFGYGSRKIGPNGDMGWIEFLLLQSNEKFISQTSSSISRENPDVFRLAAIDYISRVRKLACDVLNLLAEGLKLQPVNIFSKLIMDEDCDSMFRLNHYPPYPEPRSREWNLIGFGEHTDPQIVSVLWSNNTTGLQISLKDGSWVSIPPDRSSFFFNVGDSLQVLTNGRFKSVKHRVVANGLKPRVSMVFFGAPAPNQKIAPLSSFTRGGEMTAYKGFTWFEYKKSAYRTRLGDNRLLIFENQLVK